MRNTLRTFFLTLTSLLIFSTVAFGQNEEAKLEIAHLEGNFYVFTTYNTYQGINYPANGLYLVTNEGVVMIDTPWDTTQFQPLLDSIKLKHDKDVNMAVATHWHSDKTAGLEYYREKGIKTYTTAHTDSLSKENGMKRAEFLIAKDTTFHVGQYSFETFYPGEGHTADNIVVSFNKERILYGGCLIKGAEAEDLGNVEDGNEQEYESSLKKVQQKYPHPRYIIPTHSDWNDSNALKHSIEMAKDLKKEG